MTGGLMQLVAYGAQDIYLTGNPMITYFKVVYRRHTNFAMESIEQTFSGTVNWNNKVSALISRNGDLVSGMTLEVTLPLSTGGRKWTNDIGHHIISETYIEIGGQQIDKQYGDWLEIWAQLTVPTSKAKGYRELIGQCPRTATGTPSGLQAANSEHITTNANGQSIIHVPLQFWFCRNVGLAIPLIALQYHEVKVSVKFNVEDKVAVELGTDGATTLTGAKLWVDYIYLDTDERRRFAQVSHEYLIDQLQYNEHSLTTSTTVSTTHNIDLVFNHPVKELVWVTRDNSEYTAARLSNYTSVDGSDNTLHARPYYGDNPTLLRELSAKNPTLTAVLKLNGYERFARRTGDYFNLRQTMKHHTCVPVSPGINVYSFALQPEDHQPSGTCNFSRIDNAQLNIVLRAMASTTATFKLYAVNYNVLRIMSGMGGLAYSN